MYYVDHYVIDWGRVQTLDDVKRLLVALNLTFELDCPRLGLVIDLVRKERKPDSVAVMD
jgi:hypothetical protein